MTVQSFQVNHSAFHILVLSFNRCDITTCTCTSTPALPCSQIDMMRESELRIKHDTEFAHISREGYVREERVEPENVNLCKLPVTTEPYDLSLRGIEKGGG